MQPHGDYKIELINDVVHVFPTGSFNEEGIREVREQILLTAPKNRPWALLEHPRNLAALTSEAADELLKTYVHISKFNCKVVALEVSSIWHIFFEKILHSNLDIPYYLSNDLDQLKALVKKHLNCD